MEIFIMKQKILLNFKKVCATAAALALSAALLCGCSAAETESREAFDNTMNAFKSGDKTLIGEYYSFDRVTAYIDQADGEEFRDSVLSTLSEMNYSIKSSKVINDESVTLNVDIETVDFSAIVDDFINRVIETSNSPEYQKSISAMTDEKYNALITDIMKQCIADGRSKKSSSNIDITMIKTSNGKWVIGGNSDEVLGILFADLSNAADYLT